MRSMTFIIPGDPVPLARARIGKYSIYDAQKHEKLVAGMVVTKQMNNEPPLNGPLELEVVFFMSLPKKGNRKMGYPHFCKPDLDNMIKYICDICNKIAFYDDSAIYKITAIKMYDSRPRTVFTLREMPNEFIRWKEAQKTSK